MKTIVIIILVSLISSGAAEQEWLSLFNGSNLNGWKAGENPSSFKIVNRTIACDGPRAHLFYDGKIQNAVFKNFELKALVLTKPGANSGIYFHTAFQDTGWPEKGFEVQVNNTHRGAGDYRELKKTGSLYGVRNMYKSFVRDDEWFSMHIVVRGKRVLVYVNEILLVDYIEPAHSDLPENEPGRVISQGTFALQCHDIDSKVFFKDIFVKPLPDELPAEDIEPPVVDDVYRQIARLQEDNFPIIDYHVHIKGGMTLDQALAKSRTDGINYGITPNCGMGFPITDDNDIYEYLEQMKGQPVFLGMQAEGREWVNMFSKQAISRFDYVFTDAMTFTDDKGQRIRLWIPEEVHINDKQAFMEMYVNRILSVLDTEPIQIYVNATFLPDVIQGEYNELWTRERMHKVIDALVKNKIALEINARFRIPSPEFIKLAKQAGVKFTFGTNNSDINFGRLEYCLQMITECGLTMQDMYLPKSIDLR
jgi:hypothetical protein